MDLILQNCKTFYGGKIRSVDIGVKDGKIVKIGKKILDGKTIDCKGFFVLPGLIDVHVHFRVPGAEHKEDWKSGSAAALHGGVTCVLDMPNNAPAIIDSETLERKKEIIKKSAFVDYGLYLGASNKIENFETNLKDKIAGIKLYMSSAPKELLISKDAQRKAFEVAAKSKKVIAIHAEDEKLIVDSYMKIEKPSIFHHHKIRSDLSEAVAIEKAIFLGKETGAFFHICHISSKLGLQKLLPILKLKKATCGVTPHHLFLTNREVAKLGNKAKVNPSIKTSADRKALLNALNSGTIKVIESDHAPHTLQEKSLSYEQAPSGMPGIETMLPLLLDTYNKGLISLKRIIECCCENPAKIFEIKNKGTIALGKDADFCIVNLKKTQRIKSSDLFTKCGWSAFEGRLVKGTVEKTILRGTLCYDHGSIVDSVKGFDVFCGFGGD
ncbi:MAG: dihydroorotase family protein [Candidatus Diapherotrites archaeon]